MNKILVRNENPRGEANEKKKLGNVSFFEREILTINFILLK